MAGAGGEGEDRPAFSHKSAEIAVAGLFLAAGAIVVYDSVRLGASWGADGPKPGYFPFYVGLIICVSSLINLARALMVKTDKPFVLAGQLKMVLAVLVPSAIYVAAMTWIGLYVSSVLFIAFFMRWLGRYDWWKVAVVSIASMAVFYAVFEIWFKVPLPKGPLESLLGLG
jgi:putative tricarboxylic transport membrane protein